MILIHEEVTPKIYNLLVRGRPLYREKKKEFRGGVGFEAISECGSFEREDQIDCF